MTTATEVESVLQREYEHPISQQMANGLYTNNYVSKTILAQLAPFHEDIIAREFDNSTLRIRQNFLERHVSDHLLIFRPTLALRLFADANQSWFQNYDEFKDWKFWDEIPTYSKYFLVPKTLSNLPFEKMPAYADIPDIGLLTLGVLGYKVLSFTTVNKSFLYNDLGKIATATVENGCRISLETKRETKRKKGIIIHADPIQDGPLTGPFVACYPHL